MLLPFEFVFHDIPILHWNCVWFGSKWDCVRLTMKANWFSSVMSFASFEYISVLGRYLK